MSANFGPNASAILWDLYLSGDVEEDPVTGDAQKVLYDRLVARGVKWKSYKAFGNMIYNLATQSKVIQRQKRKMISYSVSLTPNVAMPPNPFRGETKTAALRAPKPSAVIADVKAVKKHLQHSQHSVAPPQESAVDFLITAIDALSITDRLAVLRAVSVSVEDDLTAFKQGVVTSL